MSWTDAVTYAKRLLSKKDNSQDAGLPFGAKIGGVVNFQMTPFIKAESYGSLVNAPRDGHCTIDAISTLKFGLNSKIYRYYLSKGDSEDEPEVFIQVYCNKDNEVVEALYCSQLTRFYPTSSDDQDLWMGRNGEGLGDIEFNLDSSQLAELGILSSDKNFYRAIDDHTNSFIKPLHGKEIRIDDKNGIDGLEQEVYYMPYHRVLGLDINEHLLISTEIISSKNGEDTCEIHVDLMIGIPLEISRLTIQ